MGNQAHKVQKVNRFGTEIVRIGRSCTPLLYILSIWLYNH